jgi:hypothetical protein
MDTRKSWRPFGFARRHSVSQSFIYGEIQAGRLRAHKPADGVTIITEEDEADWLNTMPTIGAPKGAAVNDENTSNNSEAAE